MSTTLQPPAGASPSHFTQALSHQPTSPFTYLNLIEFHLGEVAEGLEGKGYSMKAARQVVRNHRTAINGWMRERGFDIHSPVGDELGVEFETQRIAHLSHLRIQGGPAKRGLSASTLSSRESLLTRWMASWLVLNKTQGLPRPFSEALSSLIRNRNLSLHSIARDTGVPRSTIQTWMRGEHHPTALQSENIRRLETHLALPPDTLLSRAGLEGSSTHRFQAGATAFRRRIQKFSMRKYCISDFSSIPTLQTEWDGLEKFMSMPCPPEGMKRNSRWNEDPATGINSSAQIRKELLSRFYGFLCLPKDESDHEFRGEGFDAAKLSLALLADTTCVERFLEFRRLRASGSYTSDTTHMLSFCCSLLRAETGYLRQHPEFGERLQPTVMAEEWGALCDRSHRRFTSLKTTLSKEGAVGFGRDVEEPIRAILDRQHPIQALLELIAAIEAARPSPTANPATVAVYHRDLLLIRMLSANPLRIKHFSIMTYRPDNSGNLYQTSDGSWWLRFPSRTFKNFKHLGASMRDYRAPLPQSLWAHVESYLFEHRPHLFGSQECDYVFRHSPAKRSLASRAFPAARYKQGSLSRVVLRLTQKHLPGCVGFGPHAFRHIIATEYIKNNLDGFEVAARILHDKVETVRKTYAHLRTADYVAHWLAYYEQQQREARRP